MRRRSRLRRVAKWGSPAPRRRLIRRIAIYALVGVVWTYATTAVVVLIFPIPTFGLDTRAGFHRPDFGSSRPFLRFRVWQNAYGSYFQIHRPRDNYFNSLTERQRQRLMENPQLEDASFIPRWSRLRRDWPARLTETRELFEAGGVWYELRMGWPLHCLRGGFTTPNYRKQDTVRDNHGVIRIWRTVAFWGSARRFGKKLVSLPLIPDWPAFLGSVLLYGALSFASGTAWRSARGWRRRRRGMCVACGYDLTGNVSGTCPECGRGTEPAAGTPR